MSKSNGDDETGWAEQAAGMEPVEERPLTYNVAPRTGRLIRAKMASLCRACNGKILHGEPIVLAGGSQGWHPACADAAGLAAEPGTDEPTPEF